MRWSRIATPELLDHVQYLYEETDKPVAVIAAECDLTERTVYRWVAQRGWRRRGERPRHDLPSDLRLSLDADRTVDAAVGAGLKPAPADSAVPSDGGAGLKPAPAADDAPMDLVAAARRLERQLEKNLARVEHIREEEWPQSMADAERTTRVLERLTHALLKVRELRNSDTNTAGRDDFDIPKDIDEFRLRLAERIEAFVRSTTDAGVPGPGEAGAAG